MVEMRDVESSQISKIGWAKDTLHVIFKGGGAIYLYADCPHETFTEILLADSPGAVFNAKVRGVLKHSKREIELAAGATAPELE